MTSDETAIERMARALCTDVGVNPDRISPIALAPNWMLWRQAANAAFTALLADPPPAVERAVLERLLAQFQTRDDPDAREFMVWEWMEDRLAALTQEESDGKSD